MAVVARSRLRQDQRKVAPHVQHWQEQEDDASRRAGANILRLLILFQLFPNARRETLILNSAARKRCSAVTPNAAAIGKVQ